MEYSLMGDCKRVAAFGLAVILACCAVSACGDSGATETEQEQALIVPSAEGPSRFSLRGATSELGRYVALGELTLVAGTEEGSFDGSGVAVVAAEDGNQIVADVTADIRVDETMGFTFHWRDSIQFGDGTVAVSTGRFVDSKPPGLVIPIFYCRRLCSPTTCSHVCTIVNIRV